MLLKFTFRIDNRTLGRPCQLFFLSVALVLIEMKPPPPAHRSRGRPPAASAESHTLILDAVYELLQERSVRDLTIEAIAKRAGVSKPTIHKWWPTKADLVLAMFQERLDSQAPPPRREPISGQDAVRFTVRQLVKRFNGLFGKVMADLIAEGQTEPAVLETLYTRHMRDRRAATVANVERARAAGELPGRRRPGTARRHYLRTALLPAAAPTRNH